jgi:hypothetical protein
MEIQEVMMAVLNNVNYKNVIYLVYVLDIIIHLPMGHVLQYVEMVLKLEFNNVMMEIT